MYTCISFLHVYRETRSKWLSCTVHRSHDRQSCFCTTSSAGKPQASSVLHSLVRIRKFSSSHQTSSILRPCFFSCNQGITGLVFLRKLSSTPKAASRLAVSSETEMRSTWRIFLCSWEALVSVYLNRLCTSLPYQSLMYTYMYIVFE